VIDLKFYKFGFITLLLFGIVLALTGIVCADQVVPAVPETQALSTVTTADVDGLAMETDAGTWTLTKNPQALYSYTAVNGHSVGLTVDVLDQLVAQGGSYQCNPPPYPPLGKYVTQLSIPQSLLNVQIGGGLTWGELMSTEVGVLGFFTGPVVTGAGIHTGALGPGQVQYTTAYDANIVAQAGHTSFVKSMNIDTRNKVIGQSNLDAKTALTYIATDNGGNVVGSENLMLDGAGMPTTAADKMLCPFASAGGNVIPAYCNILQAGSKYDLTVGSVTTSANDKFIGSDGTIPVVLNYAINVKPYTASGTQVPATGSAMAYIKAHIMEGNDNKTNKAEDLTYSETSSANGYIYSFNKVIAYQSGKSLL
jgi:hypothetical protein